VIRIGRQGDGLTQCAEERGRCQSNVDSLSGAGMSTGDLRAAELADWHLHTRSRPNDPRVVAAYRQLEQQTDDLYRSLSDCTRPCGIEVIFTFLKEPYSSDQELITGVADEHRLEVSVATSDRYRLHPVLDCRPGGSYDRFRAVHDIVGHAFGRRGFDAEGEYSAWWIQNTLYRGLARLALATELRGEHAVLRETGEFAEHKALIAPRAFLVAVGPGSGDPAKSFS
jgi:hypothetical protein